MKFNELKPIEIKNSHSIISFQTTGGGSWKIWDRYLVIDGKKAFHIGNICGTCNFFFERMEGANQKISPKILLEVLAQNNIKLDSDEYFEIEKLIPNGKFLVLSLLVHPKKAVLGTETDYFTKDEIEVWGIDGFWGLPHSPKINYYRETDIEITDRKKLFSFFIPLVPENWLDEERIKYYEKELEKGIIPTAIAISRLDIKEPADWTEGQKHTEHNCFANYIIDGHHKMYAACKLGKSINILSFFSIDNSIAIKEDVESFEKLLRNCI